MARYTDGDALDLTTIERNAWQAGNTLLAQLAARAQDAEELAEGEEDRLAAEFNEGREYGRADLISDLQGYLDDAGRELDSLKRVVRSPQGKSDLAALGRALDAMQNVLSR